MSLADAFAAPIGEVKNVDGASDSSLEKGEQAYLNGSYTSALLYARDALKKNSEDALAWKLCSQAHFQLGETNEAEMTILEAIRHQPFDLDMRMDYLRIARETLSGKRYLKELEKVRDLFPQSTEILWELARRYHVVENMPVTAAVLYRKIIQIAPRDSSIAEQAEIELIKLRK
jgi:tetratricopeptide (TPR) repeat protein